MFTVLVDHIQFDRNDKRGEDGAVWYVVLRPCEKCRTNPEHHVCPVHHAMEHHYERQAFRRGAAGHRLDATQQEIADGKANVWGWDGNTEAPTVLPSFLAMEHDKQGQRIRPYRMHSFLRGGKLELCGDSTVALSTAGPCWQAA